MESNSVFTGLLYGGTASCVAETFTMPVDVVKTRLQMDGAGGQKLYRGPLDCAVRLVKAEGPSSLFKGLPPALLRQSTYGSLRYGLYGPIRDSFGVEAGTPKTDIPIWKKILAGGTAGALASAVANPTDLIKIRLQTDGQLKSTDGVSLPKKYSGMRHAFVSIVRQEGVLGLWKGTTATAARATVLAATELATYDEIKGRLLDSPYFEEGLMCTISTAAFSGLLATIASSPFDVVKSRFMGQPLNADGTGRFYSGIVQCFAKSIQSEGVMSLYNGFWPNFGRVVPRVVIVFIVMENLKYSFG